MGQQREPDIERYRGYAYHHANRLTQVVSGTLTTQYAYNGDGNSVIKAVDSATTQYVLDLAPSLPVVMSGTEAICPYGLDIISQQQAEPYWRWPRNWSQLSA